LLETRRLVHGAHPHEEHREIGGRSELRHLIAAKYTTVMAKEHQSEGLPAIEIMEFDFRPIFEANPAFNHQCTRYRRA
jgi:hypothetical protein